MQYLRIVEYFRGVWYLLSYWEYGEKSLEGDVL
jgi:hypothetical protein